MALPTSNDSDSWIKSVEYILGNPHKTRRIIQLPDKIPNGVKTWKSGGITKGFTNLGLKLQEEKCLKKDVKPGQGSVKVSFASQLEVKNKQNEDKRTVDNTEIQPAITKTNLKRNFPEDVTQRNHNNNYSRDDGNHNTATNSIGEDSSSRRLGNLQPLRTFSPPRQIPKMTTSNPNGNFLQEQINSNNNNSNNYHHTATTNNSNNNLSKYARFQDTQKNSHQTIPSVHQNGRNFNDTSKESQQSETSNPFKTAREILNINDRNNGIKRNLEHTASNSRLSGLSKKPAPSRLEQPPPNKPHVQKDEEPISDNPEVVELMEHPLMKNIDPKMVEAVLNDMVDTDSTTWNDIAGLEAVKKTIKEIIVWPMQRPDIFHGLRGPPKGILFFGPPGTGKTMMGRLIATESKSSFFSISASSLTSKWIGDGEKMVRALFAVARVKQPAVIFIDEIDSILTQRSESEHESSRRLKTEFLIQFDGCGTNSEDRILVIGVTNRPQELDEAARRRLVKRIYIPLPCADGRKQLIKNMIKGFKFRLSEDDYTKISELTEGYSGSDISSVCKEASYGPVRELFSIENAHADEIRPMEIRDFEAAMRNVKSSVDKKDLVLYEDWDQKFGCLRSS